ncbi:MAG: hypothetical protein HQL32_10725 [Planctomycetes bacterium]|nr:hypothetical protein [Planctomycetota bacterium]
MPLTESVQVSATRLHIHHPEIVKDRYAEFAANFSDIKPKSEWDLTYKGAFEKFPSLDLENSELLFDSGSSWKAHRLGENLLFSLYSTIGQERRPTACLVLNPAHNSLSFYGDELTYPLDELFFMHTFAQYQSLTLHSSAYLYKGEVTLFCGVSGAGKTTLADALKEADLGGILLCDDRNILTFSDSPFKDVLVCGSPWHGSGRYRSPLHGPLRRVYFLDPGHEDLSITAVNANTGLPLVLQTLFYPIALKADMEVSIDLCYRLVQEQECFHLDYNRQRNDIVEILKERDFF